MIKYVFILLASVHSISMHGQIFDADTASPLIYLDAYLIEAAENNPLLKSRFSEYMATVEKTVQTGVLSDPQLTFGYFIMPVETRVGPQRAKLGISQQLPWFGTLHARQDVVAQLAKSKYALFEQTRSQLYYDMRSVYFELYFLVHAVRITEENIRILRTLQNVAVVKFEAGKVSAVDELRVELELNDLENQLALLRDIQMERQVKFNKLRNADDFAQIRIPDSLSSVPFVHDRPVLLDSIVAANHILESLDHRISAWESSERAAKKEGMPTFQIGLEYLFIDKGEESIHASTDLGKNAFLLPKVGISIPFYRKKYRSMVSEASHMSEAVAFEKADQTNKLSVLLELGLRECRDAARRIELNKKQVQLSRLSMDILSAGYATDNEDFEEVLRMERRLLKYGLELEKARSDAFAAVAFIDFLTGK